MKTNNYLMQASKDLAESQNLSGVGGAAMAELDKVFQQAEKRQKEIQTKVNDYMSDLTTDIDFTTLDPEMKKEVTRALMEGKNEYAALASEIARLNDATDPRYQEIADRMSNIRQEYSTMSAEIKAYVQNKVTAADVISSGNYSKGTDPNHMFNVASIYGLGPAKATPKIIDGHLNFTVAGSDVAYAKLKGVPAIASDKMLAINEIAANLSTQGTAMTAEQRDSYGLQIDAMLQDKNVLGSIISDFGKFDDLKEQFFKLRQVGKLDAEALENIKEQVKERLLTGFDEANARGVEAAEKARRRAQGDTRTTQQKNDAQDRKTVEKYINANSPRFNIRGYTFENHGDHWKVFEEDTGLPVQVRGGAEAQARTIDDVYAILGL